MKIAEEHLDLMMDSELNKIESQKWLPWVGKNYQNSDKKILILGESFYKWDSPTSLEELNNKDFSRYVIQYQGLNHLSGSDEYWRIFRNIEKTVYNKENISPQEKENLWFSVAYNNLVQNYMESNKDRPTFGNYYQGWKTLFQVVGVLKPDICIILGNEGKKIKSLENILEDHKYDKKKVNSTIKVGKSSLKEISLEKDGKLITKLIFMRHPSQYFSWKDWSLNIINVLK